MDTKKLIFFTSVAFLVGGMAAFATGWYSNPGDTTHVTSADQAKVDIMNTYLEDKLTSFKIEDDYIKVDTDNIRNYMLNFTKEPHVAGLARDKELAAWVEQEWIDQGLDSVEVSKYNLRLSYPDAENPNVITISSDEDDLIFESSAREDIEDLPDTFINAFLAFSKAGKAEGGVVYVNYGRVEDFEKLQETEYLTSVQDMICMSRYGKLGRGSKLSNAEYYGCSGLIIFSDPEDVAGEGTDPEDVYPFTQFLPDTGIQRGSINPVNGDPTTPNWPSLDRAFRLEDEEIYVPSIPAQPIGYKDATEIFRQMDGKALPNEGWKGGIEGLEYTLGGSFKASCGTNCKVKLETFNKLETTENSNVFGIIKGEVEPDRYVLFGNHRDAWGYGAIDAATGGSQMMETTRILGEKMRTEGWRPRRSIIFASWGAEEFSLIGSREFNEDFLVKIMERAVAYVNVDICTCGPILRGTSSPTVQHYVMDATKNVPNPWNADESYYEEWKRWYVDGGTQSEPQIGLVTAGSDHASFIFYSGIPVIDLSFRPDTNIYPTAANSNYPTYHTGFETFLLMDEIIDPGYLIHGTCAKMSLYLARTFADSITLDFKPSSYHTIMTDNLALFDSEGVSDELTGLGVDLDPLREQVDYFGGMSSQWEEDLLSLNTTSEPFVTRMINDQMTKLDRLFLLNQGLPPNRPAYRHAIVTPSLYSNYPTNAFPGITDLLHDINVISQEERDERILLLKKHVSDVMIVVKAAGDYLKQVHIIA